MKTEIYAGAGANRELVKTLDILVPYMPEGSVMEVDERTCPVRSYYLLIDGTEVTALIYCD